ncbi:DUF6233 domain-containing protein [Streptomyces lunalinharesii]|uniref:Uncharacterized protein n=1 Tax=Streptomyces lunalinharesii TaxID=333384 RepID=A0ABP6F9F5_9ACTN
MTDEDGTPPSAPIAEITLPDGQMLRAPVVRRRRDRSGIWWYDLLVELPDAEFDRRRGPQLVTRTVPISAPYPVVQPVAGQSYVSLDPPPPEERQRWRVDDAPHWMRADLLIHRPDCAQTRSTQAITDTQAMEMLADPEIAVACEVCSPDAVLRHLR